MRCLSAIFLLWLMAPLSFASIYYVSSSGGNDLNNGLSEDFPFQTLGKVNGLVLQPDDQVLFKCGDIWRGEMLIITRSGTFDHPIVFGTYPVGGSPKPLLCGSFPVQGWSKISGFLYVANLQTGQNSGLFSNGINQVFREATRLPLGRWPNPGEGTFGDGYSEIDGPTSNTATILDNELPSLDWSGASVHIKGMRWYILNRLVNNSAPGSLTLNTATDCWDGSCQQWGYFINNHLETLDQDGEWFYDSDSGLLYLFSTDGIPANIEASPLLGDPTRSMGGIILGEDFYAHISYVTIQNLEISRWFMNGITTPLNWETDDNHHLILSDCLIQDVDSVGINLAGWVWNASNGHNGWRGGHDLQIINCTINRANHFGINSYAYNSIFEGNTLTDIGLIEMAGSSGIGCGDTSSGGYCTEFGDGIRVKLHDPGFSAHDNWFEGNSITRAGYCGFDVFGSNNTFLNNVVEQACFSKGDCGAIRTFGQTSLAATPVFNLNIQGNIFFNTIGNTDGAHPSFRSLFGFGIYIDYYSANIQVQDNTVINSSASGILFQNSTGSATGNTVFNSSMNTQWNAQFNLSGNSQINPLAQNIFYGLHDSTWTLRAPDIANIQNSNHNYFFNPFRAQHISVQGNKTLSQWQSASGMDLNSDEHWFTLLPEDSPKGRVFWNSTHQPVSIDLQGSTYWDLDQNPVSGSILLQPFTSKVLVLDSLCEVSATVSGDTTLCLGESTDIQVDLQGQSPWQITWQDGVIQSGISTSPIFRHVSPTVDTTYSILDVSDSQCNQPGEGTATILIGSSTSMSIDPFWTVQGLQPIALTGRFDCSWSVEDLSWLENNLWLSSSDNPYKATWSQPGVHPVQINITHDGGTTNQAQALVLVPWFPDQNLDPDGNGSNTLNDLLVRLQDWRTSSATDPDHSGFWDVRDFLFIPTQ